MSINEIAIVNLKIVNLFFQTFFMYRRVIIPTDKEHSIELPENFYGKQVEITVKEVVTKTSKATSAKKLPGRLKDKAFWATIEYNPGFPSVEEIRQIAWPKKN